LRDDKDPQIVINRARPMSDYAQAAPPVDISQEAQKPAGTLYLRLPSEESAMFTKVRGILNMFPGQSQAVVYFADTKVRKGTKCDLDNRMLRELETVIGKENVVVK
jgi:DNA polymerase-3 subunit alpha